MGKLKPVKFERDKYGCWIHPTYTKTWELLFGDSERLGAEDYELFKNSLRVHLEYLRLENDSNVSYEEFERMLEECDLSDWKPEIIEGYFEVGYWFTEDGAVAVFAKEMLQ